MQPETIVFPRQYLYPVALSVTEDEERFIKRVELKAMLDEGTKAVNGLSHVRIAAG